MKIGAFAEKFNLKKSTIRYYTDISLLLPDLSGTYPDYNLACEDDIRDILELKTMGLTIDEIHEFKVLQRFYVNVTECNMDNMVGLFDRKIQAHKASIKDFQEKILQLEKYKQRLSVHDIQSSMGLSLELVASLYCHHCQEHYNIQEANISSGILTSGKLICHCAHSYTIHNGIILPSHGKINRFTRGKQFESHDFIRKLNNKHIALVKQSGDLAKEHLQSWHHEQSIVFLNADIDLLMMSLDRIFKSTGSYFFCSNDYNSLLLLKSKLERQNVKGHFAFIYYNDIIPIAPTKRYIFDNVGNLMAYILNASIHDELNHAKPLIENCVEYLFIQLYVEPHQMRPEHQHLNDFLLETPYEEVLHHFHLIKSYESTIGTFEFVNGMLPAIEDIHAFSMKIKTYQSSNL